MSNHFLSVFLVEPNSIEESYDRRDGPAASEEQARLKLEFDFFYIKNMSAWFDMLVTLKTIRTIVLGSGAR